MNKGKIERILKEHGSTPELVIKAPGRINLIGEHTDYNDGFVLPAAVGQAIYFGISKSQDTDLCTLRSLDFDDTYEFKISEIKALEGDHWQNYIIGVVAEIVKSGRTVEGFTLSFTGDVPQGSGMSSSAALECGTCFALNELFKLGISKLEMIKMSQSAEHNYVGVMCGIMDQFASMMGKEDEALLLDCKTLDYNYFPIHSEEVRLLLCNSNVTHSLASSEYNVRRQQCEEGVAILQKQYVEIQSLRDASLDQLESVKNNMSEVVFRRCKYVIEENNRVHAFSNSLKQNDLKSAGQILKDAQHAMRYEYEITCPEIDFMADFANSREDVFGARMMGGGFGGCTINLLSKEPDHSFIQDLNQVYQQKFEREITPIPVIIGNGVTRLR